MSISTFLTDFLRSGMSDDELDDIIVECESILIASCVPVSELLHDSLLDSIYEDSTLTVPAE